MANLLSPCGRKGAAVLAASLTAISAGCGSSHHHETSRPRLITTTFASDADAYVRANEPYVNFGNNAKLYVSGSPPVRAYLKFQPFGITGKIVQATLRVYALSSSVDGFQVRATTPLWSESRITFANAPPVGRVINVSGPLVKDRWRSMDVSPLGTSPSAPVALALVKLSATELAIASRNTGHLAPRLILKAQSVGN